jgi:hypothetical protein
MARALPDSKLIESPKGHSSFAVATSADDVELRRLLRENPTRGQISLSFEREPDYFSDAHLPGEVKQTIIAREHGRIACMGSCAVRQRFVNGQPRRVGYLGGLRLDSAFAGRFDILRRGYAFLREIESESPADFYFTSIAADNERARRFLERGVAGMPRYEFIGDFVTLLVRPTKRSPAVSEWRSASGIAEECVSRVNDHNRPYHFSPVWSVEELVALETLGIQDSVVLEAQGRIVASAALWDQRNYKQTVIRGYSSFLATARPAINLGARLFGQPKLPAVGAILANAFVSHLVIDWEQPKALIKLITLLSRGAAQRGIDMLTLGFAGNDPPLAMVRANFRRREYLTRLYLVSWPGIGGSVSQLDNRIIAPEVALL